MAEKISIFDKINAVFSGKRLSKEEYKHDSFMLLRFLSMKTNFVPAINDIQKVAGVLDHRLLTLLQEFFKGIGRAPYLEYIKKDSAEYQMLSPDSLSRLKKLFNVDKKRLSEYLPNLWVSEEEVRELYGVPEGSAKKKGKKK